jgi:ABC-type cobalamin/Fe3+-siderophores transport system ATPase subunit
MDKVEINLEYCHGITKLNHSFDLPAGELINIYAPNGVMKSSFAKTFQDIRDGKDTYDEVFPERKTIRSILCKPENTELQPDQVLVACRVEDALGNTDRMRVLLANDKLRKEYESIHQNLDKTFLKLEKEIKKNIGTTKPIKDSFISDFYIDEKFFEEKLAELEDDIAHADITLSKIKYKDFFTPALDKILKQEDIATFIKDYAVAYDALTKKSTVFKTEFNPAIADKVAGDLQKEGFFSAKHKVLLNSEKEALDYDKLTQRLNDEKQRILSDSTIKENYEKIESALGTSKEANSLRAILDSNQQLIPSLNDVPDLKRRMWLAYILSHQEEYSMWRTTYMQAKEDLALLVKKAQEDKTEWEQAVDLFNLRYKNMPFRLSVVNQDDVILRQEAVFIKFSYEDHNEKKDMERNDILHILSTGECRALALLDVIFMVEEAKQSKRESILILDDIADSFDYRNKYAIIEYLHDIQKEQNIHVFSLTHNFDFYRTVGTRLDTCRTSFFIGRSNDGLIVSKGEYFNDVFNNWKNRLPKDKNIFLASIPFLRNLISYKAGNSDENYKLLTHLLHIKNAEGGIKATQEILVSDLQGISENVWNAKIPQKWQDEKIFDDFMSQAKKITEEQTSPTKLEKKIVLSIAIRLRAEQFMFSKAEKELIRQPIPNNQTRRLFDCCIGNITEQEKGILERVLIITSENIHLNSFMYEPIIDIGMDELCTLYDDVNGL